MHHTNINQSKPRVAMLISSLVDFKAKSYQTQRVMNESVHMEYTVILNVFASNNSFRICE